jgi:hypothetical protein
MRQALDPLLESEKANLLPHQNFQVFRKPA